MAIHNFNLFHTLCFLLTFLITICLIDARPLTKSAASDNNRINDKSEMLFQYHNGPLLRGNYAVNLIWYGRFHPRQRAIIVDFITSISSTPRSRQQPSLTAWWANVGNYIRHVDPKSSSSYSLTLSLGTKQFFNNKCSLGKRLSMKQIAQLAASRGKDHPNTINVVLTAADVVVDGFCMSRCGTHGSSSKKLSGRKTPYIWVGNSAIQCRQCAWPFAKPIYVPQGPPLVSPNKDIGMDGMVINLASLLAGTATNPFNTGYFQGPKEAPLEAASACPGVYGKCAFPGYPGNLLVDRKSGASYNANGVNKRKYLLPGLFDPSTASCSTLV